MAEGVNALLRSEVSDDRRSMDNAAFEAYLGMEMRVMLKVTGTTIVVGIIMMAM